ncbi:MAG: tryptophan synthase subunit alpha [Candidatus Acidiferrales bacterium]
MSGVCTSRIEALLRDRGAEGAGRLIIYLTAGDPSIEDTGKILQAVDRGGADLIEIGVPFSDPMADGVVIQRASERALRGGATLSRIMAQLPQWRRQVRAPFILFSYYNPVLQYGLDRFARDLAAAGGEGALIVDLSPEESETYVAVMRRENLDTVFLASPTSTDERLSRIGQLSTGFVYLISRPGVTGERATLPDAVAPLVSRVRRFTTLPLAVGFGLSNPDQVRQAQALAGAAVVGSALVNTLEQHYSAQGEQQIERFVRWLKSGTGSRPA